MSNMFDTEGPPEPPKGFLGNPFWVAIAVVWILMIVIGVTLALALGLATLIEALANA